MYVKIAGFVVPRVFYTSDILAFCLHIADKYRDHTERSGFFVCPYTQGTLSAANRRVQYKVRITIITT